MTDPVARTYSVTHPVTGETYTRRTKRHYTHAVIVTFSKSCPRDGGRTGIWSYAGSYELASSRVRQDLAKFTRNCANRADVPSFVIVPATLQEV